MRSVRGAIDPSFVLTCCVFQDHYDWGLRAIKSVLVVAGSLKRSDPGRPEDQVTTVASLWTVRLLHVLFVYVT